MVIDKISKISFFITLLEHTIVIGIVGVTISMPVKKYIPLVEVGLINLPKKFTEGIVLPGGPPKGEEKVENVKPTEMKPEVPETGRKGKGTTESLLPPSEVGVTQEVSLANTLDIIGSGIAENLSFKGGKVTGFSLTGTGIVTAKPDNVFVQFAVKTDPANSLRSAELEINRKIDFITYNLCRLYSIKKESIKVWGFAPQMQEQIIRTPSSLQQRDSYGNPIQKKEYKYTITKFIIINDLGNKKLEEICELIDKAISYGAIAVAEIPKDDSNVQSSSVLGSAKSRISALKGISKLKIAADTKDPNNELINYHFKEETLEKIIKEAKEQALKEAKEKVDKVKKALNFKENEMDVNFKEDISATSNEEGEITVKAEVTAILSRRETKEVGTESKEGGK
jgi:hypothetical protein